jgi:hypothetical protein
MEHMWNNRDRGKPKYSEKTLSHCYMPQYEDNTKMFLGQHTAKRPPVRPRRRRVTTWAVEPASFGISVLGCAAIVLVTNLLLHIIIQT